ncbi:hypothetical protein [Methanoculleus chikugoensis]|uniref:hypothetical protein n=1 Tax=Methanoculleus chikugoensis TaxID=118126 RepID=UPI001FB3F60E|nr:hypothetical protein [Methanoculleus chikugoensis]
MMRQTFGGGSTVVQSRSAADAGDHHHDRRPPGQGRCLAEGAAGVPPRRRDLDDPPGSLLPEAEHRRLRFELLEGAGLHPPAPLGPVAREGDGEVGEPEFPGEPPLTRVGDRAGIDSEVALDREPLLVAEDPPGRLRRGRRRSAYTVRRRASHPPGGQSRV